MLTNSSEMVELAAEQETAKTKKAVIKNITDAPKYITDAPKNITVTPKNITVALKKKGRPKKTVLSANSDPQSSTSTERTRKPHSSKKIVDSLQLSPSDSEDDYICRVCSENTESMFKDKKCFVCRHVAHDKCVRFICKHCLSEVIIESEDSN